MAFIKASFLAMRDENGKDMGTMATGQAKEPLLLKAFWDALPEEFEAKDFKATAQEVGLSIPTAERYIRQWVDTRLDKVSRGRYRKR